MFDLVTVGHFAIDLIITPSMLKPKRALGGPPTYVSLAAKKLDANVSVISRVGGDFPPKYVKWLRKQGVDLSGLKIVEDAQTTSFLLKYHLDGDRDLFLRGRAPQIDISDIQSSIEARAIHVSPIANEFPINLMPKISSAVDTVSLDPQGLLRSFNEDGRVSLHGIEDLNFLKYIKISKSSEKEAQVLTGELNIKKIIRKIRKYGVEIAIVTRGGRGAVISFNNKFYNVPAAEPKVIADPTGAGDAFIGAFLSRYVRGEDPLWCACIGSAAASFVMEKIGPRGFRGESDVCRRAAKIYEKL